MVSGTGQFDGPPLIDPGGRDARQLLDGAMERRSSGQLQHAIASAYQALRAAQAERAHDLVAASHLFLSEALGDMGYWAMERIHAKAAYRAMEGGSPDTRAKIGPFYARLGAVSVRGGDFPVAAYYLKRALEAHEGQTPPDPQAVMKVLLELAGLSLKEARIGHSWTHDGLENLKAAQAYLERAMSVADGAPRSLDLLDRAAALQAQMLLYLAGNLPEQNEREAGAACAAAEKQLRSVVARCRQRPGNPSDLFQYLNDLMTVLRRAGRYVEATDVGQEILQMSEKLQRGDADLPLNMMLVCENLSDKSLSLKLSDIVMRQEESMVAEATGHSSEALALAFSAQSRRRSMICMALLSRSAATDSDRARRMLDIVLRRKAVVADAQEAFWKTLHENPASDLKQARARLVALRVLLGTKVAKGECEGLWRLVRDIEHAEEVLSVEPWWREFRQDEARAKEREGMQRYARALLEGEPVWDAVSAHGPSSERQTPSAELIAAALAPGSALVEFVRIDDFDLRREFFAGSARYWALILKPDGRVTPVDLGDAGALDAEIKTRLSALLASDALMAEPQLKAMSKLYELLWAPLASALEDVERIVLSPDSMLALVPFAALVDAHGQFLVERHTLYHLSSGRELVEVDTSEGTRGGPVVLVADPDFGPAQASTSTPADRLSSSRYRLERLEGTHAEAEEIRAVFNGGAVILERERATESAVRGLERPRVLHLATHGIFQALPPAQPDHGLSPEDAAAARGAYVNHVRALSRSGIALSGINSGGFGAEEDGFLTAFEVAGMNLLGTDLVVLSACDTGLGDPVAGEGVLGLRRAFKVSGARHIVISLWRLSDKEAVRQMRAFYFAYAKGAEPITALTGMQRARIKRLREVLGEAPPALWASLTVQGYSPPPAN